MAEDSGEYFLGRGGDVFGPYTKTEIDKLKASGEFNKYSWFWGPQNESWVAINPPPKPPKMQRGGAASLSDAEARAQASLEPVRKHKKTEDEIERVATRLQAVCHIGNRIVSGIVQDANAKGFLLMSRDYPESIPPFSKGCDVKINLLDDVSGLTENHQGKFTGLGRRDSLWELHFKWEKLPKLLSK